MPKFVSDLINKQGDYQVSEDQGEVALLFCDILEFDSIIAVEQSNIVETLDKFFRNYDTICENHGCSEFQAFKRSKLWGRRTWAARDSTPAKSGCRRS